MDDKLNYACDIGIMAYNEEKNICRLLQALIDQNLEKVRISNIFVIASGCTDRTVEIVREFSRKNKSIKLLIQKKREGKPSAIDLFIKSTQAEILILESGDTYPEKETIEKLILPFADKEIGMTGAHVIPINNKNTFMGFAVYLLWKLHHLIALKKPKMGELIAFRKIFQKIPITSAVDEANIEPLVKGQGYRLKYIPEAIVYNKGPANLQDFIAQRRRIYVGHLALKENQGYIVSTMSGLRVFFTLLGNYEFTFQYIFFTPFVILLEIWARILGAYDFYHKKETHHIWEVCATTKDLTKK